MSTRLCLLLWLHWFLCFRFDALTELGAFMRTEFLCISVLRAASGPRVKLASCKSALNPQVVYSTDRSKAVVPVLVLLFVALWFILRGDFRVLINSRFGVSYSNFSFLTPTFWKVSTEKYGKTPTFSGWQHFTPIFKILVRTLDLLYVFPCVILFLCFLVLLVLRLPRLGKRELILVLFVRLFGLCLFGFVGFLFLLGSGKGCGLWLWHSLGPTPWTFLLPYFTFFNY